MAKEPFAARLTSIWLGAIFFWMLKGFKGKLSEEISNNETRNMWAGYIISLVALLLLVYHFFIRE
jgi:hypothetical protein